MKSRYAILPVLSATASLVCSVAAAHGAFDVRDFGAKGDGETKRGAGERDSARAWQDRWKRRGVSKDARRLASSDKAEDSVASCADGLVRRIAEHSDSRH